LAGYNGFICSQILFLIFRKEKNIIRDCRSEISNIGRRINAMIMGSYDNFSLPIKKETIPKGDGEVKG